MLIWGLVLAFLAGVQTPTQSSAEPTPSLAVPPGFLVEPYAEGLAGPRALAAGPDGILYVSLDRSGEVARMEDRDGDGRAEAVTIVATGLDRPHELVWRAGELWVVEMTRVVRIAAAAAGGPFTVVVDGLPEDGSERRPLAFTPDSAGFYLAIASSCAGCAEGDLRRAAVVRYDLDGNGSTVWATGLGHVTSLAVHPTTGELWATDVSSVDLGSTVPPEEFNLVRRGQDYGWPYCYAQRAPRPEYSDPGRCDPTEPPLMMLPAGSAPVGLAFYVDSVFPEEYRGDLFVALRGSEWASLPARPGVVRLELERARPVRAVDFVVGWSTGAGHTRGRPSDVLVGRDGALYVSDDLGGRVWRIRYVGEEGRGTAATRPG